MAVRRVRLFLMLMHWLSRVRFMSVAVRMFVVRMFVVVVGVAVIMLMRRLARAIAGHNYVNFCARDSAAHDFAGFKPRAYVEGLDRGGQRLKGNARIHESAQHHISAYAGETLQISNSHRVVILNGGLCAAACQHFNGQKGIERAGAEAGCIERDVLVASSL